MEHNLEQTISVLRHTPRALDALVRGLPESWIHANEGENTWSVFEVVGHLIDSERQNWIPRAKWLLQHGETKAFPPFDRGGLLRETQGRSLGQLLDEFARVRSENLEALPGLELQEKDLERRGMHPALGAVTLANLLATWAAHDLTHLHQISRIMANQYREAVGPWTRFLGVMQCAGHSEKT